MSYLDGYADQNLRMANKMLEQQGEINALRAAADLARRALRLGLDEFGAPAPDVAKVYAALHQGHEVLAEALGEAGWRPGDPVHPLLARQVRPEAGGGDAAVSFYPAIDCPACGQEVLGAACDYDWAAEDGHPTVPVESFTDAEFACPCGTTTCVERVLYSRTLTVHLPEPTEEGT